MSMNDLFTTLLRPAVLHILRAAGFHSAKPSVVDTLVDLTARHLFLLASRAAYHAYLNHNDVEVNISDVRIAMQDCGVLVPTLTATEEAWKEILRKPLEDYVVETGARAKEAKRRDAEDTEDVNSFIDFVQGKYNATIMRMAVGEKNALTEAETLDREELEDYLNSSSSTGSASSPKTADTRTALMKKHSKTGVESRFQGTVLGHPNDPKPIKIEGGPVDSIDQWNRRVREKAAKTAEATENHDADHGLEPRETVEDVVMEAQ